MTSSGAPPPDTPREKLRDWKRSLSGLPNHIHWLITKGFCFLLGFAVLYVAGGAVLGWSAAYELLVAIKSPADTSCRPLAWLLSVAGWLLMPAFVGGVTGYLVSRQVENRRKQSAEDLLRAMEGESGPNRSGGGPA
ncbi:DUF6313 family protein [Streptomyces griseorubiginosus]|uniref:DUF6313 family protein n=1 Tax=Streptomyces griseorubiginosus TaxID=67304 RepID=UPI0036DFE3C2